VFAVGIPVILKLSGNRGIVTGILISDGSVLYRVSISENGSYKELYLNRFEFDVTNKKYIPIGFEKEEENL
jgi:hypothetical protein